MMDFFKKSDYLLFTALIILTITNVIQGFSTELLSDEAYYWVYSKSLDWGFFDHPPMVAIWITISNFFFNEGEIGVRFFSAFTFSTTVYLLWKTINHPKKKEFTWLFLLIVFSSFLFNIYGFITVPDTPLLFFMAIFLLGYKKYLNTKPIISYILITVAMAGMLYSKYQGILIILFALLSNLKVLKDYKIWLASLGTLLLFTPHLYWQFLNDYPTFRYHLFERSASSTYKIKDSLLHIVNAIAIIGFTFPVVYKLFFKNLKNNDLFNKSLNFIVIGFLSFFFLMSFKGHVQAQWIVPISLPLIIITFYGLIANKKYLKTFKILAFSTITVLIFARVLITSKTDFIKTDFHGNKAWVEKVKSITKNKPVLFDDRYQTTASYWFYSKDTTLLYQDFRKRKTQFGLIKDTSRYNEKDIFIFRKKRKDFPNLTALSINKKDSFFLSEIRSYTDVSLLNFELENSDEIHFISNKKTSIEALLPNIYSKKIDVSNFDLKIAFRSKKNKVIAVYPLKINLKNTLKPSNLAIMFDLSIKFGDLASDIKSFELVGRTSKKLPYTRLSKLYSCKID